MWMGGKNFADFIYIWSLMRCPPIGADRTAPRVKEEPIQLPSTSLLEGIFKFPLSLLNHSECFGVDIREGHTYL